MLNSTKLIPNIQLFAEGDLPANTDPAPPAPAANPAPPSGKVYSEELWNKANKIRKTTGKLKSNAKR